MAAQQVTALPTGYEWLYELKRDGSPYSATVTDSRMSRSRAAGVAKVDSNTAAQQTGVG